MDTLLSLDTTPDAQRPVFAQPEWAQHDPRRMTRDFLFWRHLRVVRARAMRHVRHFATRLSGGPEAQPVRTTYGVRMVPNWGDRTYAYCHYGTYGPYLFDLIHSIDQPFLFLDVGANQGLFSLIAAQNPSCEAIVALDPVPDTHQRLQRNFRVNGIEDRATALNFGLSDTNTTSTITMDKRHSGVATLGNHLEADAETTTQQQVELRTMHALDDVLPMHLPIFVKIDVEGHEPAVIEQILRSHHAERVIGIFYEHDERWCKGERLDAAFDAAGFHVARQYGRGAHYDALAVPLWKGQKPL